MKYLISFIKNKIMVTKAWLTLIVNKF